MVEEFAKCACRFAWSVVRRVNNGSLRGSRFEGGVSLLSKCDEAVYLDQEVTEALWPGAEAYNEDNPQTGNILIWVIDEDGEFTLVVECEELAAEDNGGEKFKWTYYVRTNE